MKTFEVIFSLVAVLILAACNNSSIESSNSADKQAEHNSSSQTANGEAPKENTGTNKMEKNTAANDAAESQKEVYLKKLNDTKKEMDERRNNPEDDSTYAMKKVEGDRYDTWDGLVNEIYGVLQKQLSSDEMEQLRNEQRKWIEYRDSTAKEASLKYEGGTMEELEYVAVLGNLTEERCFELVEKYMQ